MDKKKANPDLTAAAATERLAKICAAVGLPEEIETLKGQRFLFRFTIGESFARIAGTILSAQFLSAAVYDEPEVAPEDEPTRAATPEPQAVILLTTDALVLGDKFPETQPLTLLIMDTDLRWTYVDDGEPAEDVFWSKLEFPDYVAFGSAAT